MSPGNGPACMHLATSPFLLVHHGAQSGGMHLWSRECQGVSGLTWQMSLDSVDNGVEPEVRNRWKPHGTRLPARCLNDGQMRPYGQKRRVGALLGAFWDRFFRDWRPDRALRCRACHLALSVQDRQVNSSPDHGDKAVESHVRNRWKPHGTRLSARCLNDRQMRPYGQKGRVGALLGAFWDRFFRDWRPDRALRCRACHLALSVQDRQVNSSPDHGDKAVESHVRNRWKPHGTRLPARCLKNGHARIWRQETHGKVPQQTVHFHAFLHPDRA